MIKVLDFFSLLLMFAKVLVLLLKVFCFLVRFLLMYDWKRLDFTGSWYSESSIVFSGINV